MSFENTAYDQNIICPVTGQTLFLRGEELVTSANQCYTISDGIPLLYADENTENNTRAIQSHYESSPFPNYNDFDSVASFVKQADAGIFARLLREQIPINSKILEVGCGTAQLSNYLATTTMSHVYAADMTLASLQLGHDFAKRNGIEGISFLQMNLFKPALKPESMDIVISNGVLHHTYDTKAAFMSISRLVKPGGYIIIGLYNHIGRLRLDFRRLLIKNLGEWAALLDPHVRKNLSTAKRQAWIRDQYFHPQERKHSISELMGWFTEAGFSFVSSIPKITSAFSHHEKLFEQQDPGTAIDRFVADSGMLFSSLGAEGGLFICIGKKELRD